MKKFLFLLLVSFLVLAACGQEESKSEDKKETKSSDKDDKKDNGKKKDEDKKTENSDKEKSDDKKSEDESKKDSKVESKKKTEPKKDKVTDEQKLKKSVKKEVGKKNFAGIVYNEYDNIAVITLKDYSGFSEKSALREMQGGAADALIGVKNSKLDIDNVDIVVEMDMEDNKMNTSKENVLKMSFNKDLITNMNKDNKYKLREDAESYATEYWVDPAFR